MKKFAMILAPALALAACGSSEDSDGDAGTTYSTPDGSVTVTGDEDGTTVYRADNGDAQAVVKTGKGSADALPKGFTAYPGADITLSVDGRQGGKNGGVLMMETSDAPEKVIAFYKKQVEDAGLVIETEGRFSGSHTLGAKNEDETFGFSVTAQDTGGKTQIQIGYGTNA